MLTRGRIGTDWCINHKTVPAFSITILADKHIYNYLPLHIHNKYHTARYKLCFHNRYIPLDKLFFQNRYHTGRSMKGIIPLDIYHEILLFAMFGLLLTQWADVHWSPPLPAMRPAFPRRMGRHLAVYRPGGPSRTLGLATLLAEIWRENYARQSVQPDR